MKKILSLCIALALVCCFDTIAFAAGAVEPDAAITDTDAAAPDDALVIAEDEPAPNSQSPPAAAKPPAAISPPTSVQPIEVRMEMVGDIPYITKVYESPKDGDADVWMRQVESLGGFEQDGHTFARYDSHTLAQPGDTETRTETKTPTLPVERDDTALVIAAADPTVSYDEGGFIGRLDLVRDSITITGTGGGSYRYRVTDVREYKNLDRQDAAYIPKTVTKNGAELQLENVEWTVMGTTPTADGLIANLFTATATYAGSATGSRAGSYTATFRYEGTVSKEVPGSTLVSVVFRGEKTAAPVPVPEVTAPARNPIPVLPILAGILGVGAVLAIALAAFLTRGKWSRLLARERYGDTRDVDIDNIRRAAVHGYEDEPGMVYAGEADQINMREENDEEHGQDDECAGEGYFYGQRPHGGNQA